MRPHLMTAIRDSQGNLVDEADVEPWLTPLSPENAAVMRADMVGVVEDGTATSLQIPGFEVGGKTGTAQLGTEPPRSHTWIIGFGGPPGQPATVAVAVVVLNQSGASEATGGRIAAPIARAVMEAALTVR
jgi:peptidoglycan glycosyltransferase